MSKPKLVTLESLREALGLTQEQLAKELGMSRMSISRYEKGEREPVFTTSQIKALNRLLKQLDLTIEDLPDTLKNSNLFSRT